MKNTIKKTAFAAVAVLASLIFAGCGKKAEVDTDTRLAIEDGKTVVERYGQLHVQGTGLADQNNNPVQLRGMSSHGLQWHGKFANEDVLRWLRDDWNCQIWRSAMYVTEGGYANNQNIKLKVIDSVEAAIKLGMYVIIDWHILANGDPLTHMELAKEFFDEMSKKYGSYPNVLYEICNEPNGDNVTWDDNIKPYAEEIIKVIRANDPDNIIIAGTPRWSQRVDLAAKNQIKSDSNIMYTLHFYAGSHKKANMNLVKKAAKKKAAIFCTEWGTTKESGDGGVFEKETEEWLSLLKKYNISWTNWSVNNKGEDSGILKFNADRFAKGGWQEKDLSPDGIYMRKLLRNEIEIK